MNDKSKWCTGFDSSQAKQYEFLVNNTWHFFVISLSVWPLMRCREAMQSQKPCHRSDPHRNGVLTLATQSKGQTDVTGMWEGTREGGQHTKLLKNKNKNHWETGCFLGICLKSLPTVYMFNISLSFVSLSLPVRPVNTDNLDQVSVQDFCHSKVNDPTASHWPLSLRGKDHALIMSGAPFKTRPATHQKFMPCWNTGSKELDQSQSTTVLHS